MKKLLIVLLLPSFLVHVVGQDTFSIVAADSTTGEIGSAGATCLDDRSFPGSGGAIIISDVLPGIGAVHTQSYYLEGNQRNANQRLREGMSASEINEWLQNNDVQNNKSVRQYGMLTRDADGRIHTDAFTGVNCLDVKDHRVGPNYAIQGNILIGQRVLDSMEARFLNTQGDLCDKLMAALQGANIPGADSRCLSEGVSSRSAFIRVARPDNKEDDFFMDLNVPQTPFGVEPIDELQKLFDVFKSTIGVEFQEAHDVKVFPNPADDNIFIQFEEQRQPTMLSLVDAQGKVTRTWNKKEFQQGLDVSEVPPGLYSLRWVLDGGLGFYKKMIIQ